MKKLVFQNRLIEVSYYCPNCLFEVPTSSCKSEKNRCARNCLECPNCESTLTVLSDSRDETTIHYLACSFCKWDSFTECGLKFDRPTGLSSQIAKIEEEQPEWIAMNREFEGLREYYDQVVRAHAP